MVYQLNRILFNEHPSRIIQSILGTILSASHRHLAHRRYHLLLRNLPARVPQNSHPVPSHWSRIQGKKGYFIIKLVQQQGYNPFKILRQIHQSGAGLSGVFEGFDAHLWGRLSYLFVRNTIYSVLYN